MKQPKISDLKIDEMGTKKMRQKMSRVQKIKITVNIDEDVLSKVRKMAERQGAPYQTYLNHLLRESVVGKKDDGVRLDRLEKEIARIKKQLAA